MKTELKNAIDASLKGMDWHGETQVWRAVHGHRATRTVPLRAAVAACVMAALIGATALAAYTLIFSPHADASLQARAALRQSYGLTDEIIGMFSESIQEQGDTWTATYSLPIYDTYAGTYTVRKDNGAVSASWSLEGATFPADGSLSSPVWGAPQLERLRAILRSHNEAAATYDGDLEAASLEERAAIDAPLQELPYYYDAIHILPNESDTQPTEAAATARATLENAYHLAPGVLDGQAMQYSFCLTPEGLRTYRFNFTADDGAWYLVWFASPSGSIVRMESSADMAPAPVEILDEQPDERTPDDGDLSQEEALRLANAALCGQFGLTEDELNAMHLSVSLEIDNDREADPLKVWFVWYQSGMENYQVTVNANDGAIESIDYFDDSMGMG